MTVPVEVPAPSDRKARRGLRSIRRGLLLLALALSTLAMGHAEYRPTELEMAMAPYRYSILSWELSHLSHKWTHSLSLLWPGRHELTERDKADLVREFFDLGIDQKRMESQLRQAELGRLGQRGAGAIPLALPDADYLTEAIAQNQDRRRELLPHVEHIVEETLTSVLREQGLETRWLGVFPPMDTTFGNPPNVLVLSPRDRIYREEAVLLLPQMDDTVKEELERLALELEDLSAVVAGTAGLAVYPSIVLDTAGLRYGLEVAAHEWVHHWLLFRPLGRGYLASPEMLTLNETAATIAGEELGDLAYTTLTGEEVTRPWIRSSNSRFDFTDEMRKTRLRAEMMLSEGDIEGAEAFMEERRHLFVSEGYNIRKINQAYFAFHGSYATGPGSVSPIGEQMEELRSRSGSLGEFLKTVGQFGSYEEYLEYWEAIPE